MEKILRKEEVGQCEERCSLLPPLRADVASPLLYAPTHHRPPTTPLPSLQLQLSRILIKMHETFRTSPTQPFTSSSGWFSSLEQTHMLTKPALR